MNPQLRTGVIIVLVGVLLIALGIFGVLRLLNIGGGAPAAQPTPVAETLITVVFAANDIPEGIVITIDDVILSEIPIQFAPRNTLSNLDDVIGFMTTTDVVQGEMLLTHNLARPTSTSNDIAYILDENHVLMALPAVDLMSREAIIQRGDIVDILVTYNEMLASAVDEQTTEGEAEEEQQQVTFAANQRLSITAIVVDIIQNPEQTTTTNPEEQPAMAPTREQMVVQAYLVALQPQDALVLKYLKDAGGIFDFVLRAPTSTGQFQLTPVTAEFIKELYGLELLP